MSCAILKSDTVKCQDITPRMLVDPPYVVVVWKPT